MCTHAFQLTHFSKKISSSSSSLPALVLRSTSYPKMLVWCLYFYSSPKSLPMLKATFQCSKWPVLPRSLPPQPIFSHQVGPLRLRKHGCPAVFPFRNRTATPATQQESWSFLPFGCLAPRKCPGSSKEEDEREGKVSVSPQIQALSSVFFNLKGILFQTFTFLSFIGSS